MKTKSMLATITLCLSIMVMMAFSLNALAQPTGVGITSPISDGKLVAPTTSVTLTGTATETDPNATLIYQWNISNSIDQSITSLSGPSVSYQIPANAPINSTITATLVVTNSAGAAADTQPTRTLQVAAPLPQPTQVLISTPASDGTTAAQGSQVVFSGSATNNDPNQTPLFYSWIISDGNSQSTLNGQTVTYPINSNVAVGTRISATLYVTNSVNIPADSIPQRFLTVSAAIPPPLSANLVYVANYLSDTVTIIDPASNDKVATLSVNGLFFGQDVSQDGKIAYILFTNAGVRHGSVSVIDTTTKTVTARSDVEDGPYSVAVTPDGKFSYATHFDYFGTVTVTDTASNNLTATISVGSFPFGIVITPDGKNAYVANNFDGTVSVIDTGSKAVTKTITLDNFYPYRIGNVLAASTSQFSRFNVNSLILSKSFGTLSLSSSFTLGTNSLGIAPSFETTTLKIGSLAFAFPPNTFQQEIWGWYMVDWMFLGSHVNALIQPLGNNQYSFNMMASPTYLAGIDNTPMIVTLTIGNQAGSELVYPTISH